MYKLLNIILMFLFIVADCNADSAQGSLDPRCLKRPGHAPGTWVCMMAIESWYYDMVKNDCIFTTEASCGGTQNFYTQLECVIACIRPNIESMDELNKK